MKYNDTILYNGSGILYNGNLVLNIKGIANPVRVNDVQIVIVGDIDYSNFTSGGAIQIDIIPTSEISFTLTDIQATAISELETINIGVSAETFAQLIDITANAEAQIINNTIVDNSEISVINISTEGTLLIPNS